MNDSEKCRRNLLEQTRQMYSDRGNPPAVHPRYGAAYNRLYEEDVQSTPGTFGIRVFLCLMLFAAFAAMDYKGSEIMNVNCERITEEITTDIDVEEVWKNL